MNNLKDKLSTIVAIVLVVFGAVDAYLQSLVGDINWFQLAMAIIIAIIAYLTGKKPNGTSLSANEASALNR